MRNILSGCALLLMTLVGSGVGRADAGDPPSRVARLNLKEGAVSFRPGGVEEWGAASLNYPLTTGDGLWVDAGARAELHIGSTAIRMRSETAVSIVNLDDRIAQISLTAGSIEVRIRYLGEQESYEVDTPNAAISLLRAGDYRITADGDSALTVATVRAGQAEVTAAGTAFAIRAGESARLTGTGQVAQEMGPVPPPDGFDDWAMSRDRREASLVSARYVPREMIGYEDLDQYGTWSNVPDYGWCWTPRAVVRGWAPYRYGHWVWLAPWGWTWVDDAPWGFAPFHYGRWAFVAGGWIWTPGRLVVGVRPVYAPALVAFVGGPGFGVGVGVGVTAFQNINIVHVTNVSVMTNVRYANQNVHGAVTAVPQSAFAGARPVAAAAVPVGPREMAGAQVMGGAPRIAPARASYGTAAAPPARYAGRPVVSKMAPPAAGERAYAPARSFQNDRPPASQPQIMTTTPAHTTSQPVPPPSNSAPYRYDRPAGSSQPSTAHQANGGGHVEHAAPAHKDKAKSGKEEKKP